MGWYKNKELKDKNIKNGRKFSTNALPHSGLIFLVMNAHPDALDHLNVVWIRCHRCHLQTTCVPNDDGHDYDIDHQGDGLDDDKNDNVLEKAYVVF